MDNTELLQKWEIEYKKGYSKPVLLILLSEDPNYPFRLTKEISKRTKDQISIASSNIYPILKSLLDEGLVVAKKTDPSREKARIIYSITDEGRSFLTELKASMNEFLQVLEELIKS
ncbi:MAG: PadR family transcriptional regulator [Promethearchaeota archaeon]